MARLNPLVGRFWPTDRVFDTPALNSGLFLSQWWILVTSCKLCSQFYLQTTYVSTYGKVIRGAWCLDVTLLSVHESTSPLLGSLFLWNIFISVISVAVLVHRWWPICQTRHETETSVTSECCFFFLWWSFGLCWWCCLSPHVQPSPCFCHFLICETLNFLCDTCYTGSKLLFAYAHGINVWTERELQLTILLTVKYFNDVCFLY